MGEPLDGLAACAYAYGDAVRALAEQEPSDGPDGLRHAEQVLVARIALYRCLMNGGWAPPEDVALQVAADMQLLVEPSHDGHGWGERGRPRT